MVWSEGKWHFGSFLHFQNIETKPTLDMSHFFNKQCTVVLGSHVFEGLIELGMF